MEESRHIPVLRPGNYSVKTIIPEYDAVYSSIYAPTILSNIRSPSTVMMDAEVSSETSVKMYQTKRCHIRKASHRHSRLPWKISVSKYVVFGARKIPFPVMGIFLFVFPVLPFVLSFLSIVYVYLSSVLVSLFPLQHTTQRSINLAGLPPPPLCALSPLLCPDFPRFCLLSLLYNTHTQHIHAPVGFEPAIP